MMSVLVLSVLVLLTAAPVGVRPPDLPRALRAVHSTPAGDQNEKRLLDAVRIEIEHQKPRPDLNPVCQQMLRRFSDQEVFVYWARSHLDYSLREAALASITDQTVLARIALTDRLNRWTARERLTDPAIKSEVERRDAEAEHLASTISEMTATALFELARTGPTPWVRAEAVASIRNLTALESIATAATDPEVRAAAVARVSDPALLESLARSDTDPIVRVAAIRQVTNTALLRDTVADPNQSVPIRLAAARALGGNATVVATGLRCARGDASACETLAGTAESSRDPQKRLVATRWLVNQERLRRIARRDPDASVRLTAADGLTDPDVQLATYLGIGAEKEVSPKLVARVPDAGLLEGWARAGSTEAARRVRNAETLREIALQQESGNDCSACVAALETLPNGAVQELALLRSPFRSVRLAAAKQATNPDLLLESARRDSDESVRRTAVRRFGDHLRLAEIATRDPWKTARLAAIDELSDQEVLRAIARGQVAADVRIAALERLASLQRDDPDIRALALEPGHLAVRRAAIERLPGAFREPGMADSALGRLGQDPAEPEVVRLAAIDGLNDVPTLAAVVAGRASLLIRIAAVRRLKRKGAEDAIAELARQVEDDAVRAALNRALPSRRGRRDESVNVCAGREVAVSVKECQAGNVAACGHLVQLIPHCQYEWDQKAMLRHVVGQDDALRDVARSGAPPEVRILAVQRIQNPALQQTLWLELLADEEAVGPLEDQALLARLAKGHPDSNVRVMALRQVMSPDVLAEAALQNDNDTLRWEATARLEDPVVLERVARYDQSASVRAVAVSRIMDHALLAEIARHDGCAPVRIAALTRLSARVVAEIARSADSITARLNAVRYLGEQTRLAWAARTASKASERRDAIQKLDDLTILRDLAATDPDRSVREAAAARRKTTGHVEGIAGYAPLLNELAWHDPEWEIRAEAIRAVVEASALLSLATQHPDRETRRAAVRQIQDEVALRSIVLNPQEELSVRLAAIGASKNPDVLEEVAREGEPLALCLAAVERLAAGWGDPRLIGLATSAEIAAVREVAAARITSEKAVASLAQIPGQRDLAERRTQERNSIPTHTALLVGGLGLELSKQRSVSVNGLAASPMAFIDPMFVGLQARPWIGMGGMGADVGVFASVWGAEGELTIFPIVGVGLSYSLFHTWDAGGGGMAPNVTYHGPRVEARLFELFRVSYAHLTPTTSGRAASEWTFGIQLPFTGKELRW